MDGKVKGTTKEHYKFLDRLRDSSVTNMFGGGPYLEAAFDLTRSEAKEILKSWMLSKKD